MSIPEFRPERRRAFRQLLVETAAAPKSRRRAPWAGIGAFVVAGLLAGGAVTAAYATFQPQNVPSAGHPVDLVVGLRGVPAPEGVSPGSPIISLRGQPLAFQVAADGTSPYPAPADSGWTAVVPLTPPEGATHVRVTFACLTAGTVRFGLDAGGNNGSSGCSEDDVATIANGSSPGSWMDRDLADGTTLYIDSDPGVASRFTLQFVQHIETAWGINEAGETFGNYKEGAGEADLMSATATNGERGYIRKSELHFVDGTAAMDGFTSMDDVGRWQEETAGKSYLIPVYESDGVTVIGEFPVG